MTMLAAVELEASVRSPVAAMLTLPLPPIRRARAMSPPERRLAEPAVLSTVLSAWLRFPAESMLISPAVRCPSSSVRPLPTRRSKAPAADTVPMAVAVVANDSMKIAPVVAFRL